MSGVEHISDAAIAPLAGWRARLAGWIGTQGHDSMARRVAGTAFLIRVASAALLFLTQILLARWMGAGEFGHYVYVWTWTLLVGDLAHLGLGMVAPRFIPQYTQSGRNDLLRGFIATSVMIAGASAVAAGLACALVIQLAGPALDPAEIVPLYIACLVLPAYVVSIMLDGIARSYDRIGLALLPPYVLRPLFLVAAMALAHYAGVQIDAAVVMTGALGAAWCAFAIQFAGVRRLVRRTVPAGPRAREVGTWLSAALPVLMVLSFFTLLTYTDILVLRQFAAPEEVATYYAATKTLALVAFVYFAVSAAVAHRFTAYHVAGDHARLAQFVATSVGWTFWPSLAAMVAVLALGWPILWLFGPGFVAGYPLMFIFAVGLVARASIGPAERLLNMVGQQRACAGVYASAFALNLVLCLILVPRLGPAGAAASTASALIAESAMLFFLVRARLGIDAFVFAPGRAATKA